MFLSTKSTNIYLRPGLNQVGERFFEGSIPVVDQ